MFDPLLDNLNLTIKSHGGQPIDIKNGLDKCFSKKTNSQINNWLWHVPGYRRWRVTRLDSGKRLQVLNSVAYPNFNTDKPLMGIDLLWFGMQEKLVAVLDFQPLVQEKAYFDKYYEGLKLLKSNYKEFSSQNNMNSYDPNQYFSPWILFCRGGLKEVQYFLPEILPLFLNCYWELDMKSMNHSFQIQSEEVKKLQISYDKYSAERDPAHNLFSGFFGKEWSNTFLNEFLFPLS